jgi:hypothetical protein
MPLPIREWDLLDVVVAGSTVTVNVRVYVGVDVDVTLDGREPDSISGPSPVLEHVFNDVAPGTYDVEINDVVGFSEVREITVAPRLGVGGMPQWLVERIRDLEDQAPGNPPQSITRYEYQGQTVYYLTAVCCDVFSDLYDAKGIPTAASPAEATVNSPISLNSAAANR